MPKFPVNYVCAHLNLKEMICEQVDVFSFGIALWELLTGEEPYVGMHCGAIIGKSNINRLIFEAAFISNSIFDQLSLQVELWATAWDQ